MKSGIYVIENKINGKKYVGQGVDAEKRMWQNHHGCIALLDAFSKYGEENFERYVVEFCSKELLDEKEQHYIKKLESHTSQNGYNISWGGTSPNIGRILSQEWRNKIASSLVGLMAGNKNPQFGKKGKDNPNYGSKRSAETKAKMSNRGNPRFGIKSKDSSSKYFGVSKKIDRGKYIYWRVNFKLNGVLISCGETFKSEIEAAHAYDKYIIANNLDRPLNFPENL